MAARKRNTYRLGKYRYTSIAEFNRKTDQYFDQRAEDNKAPTLSGLALHLGISMDTLWRYQGVDKFSEAVKNAKLRITDWLEERVASGKLVAGGIFLLKNHGFTDAQTVNINDASELTKDQLTQKLNHLLSKASKKDAQIVKSIKSNKHNAKIAVNN